MKKKSRSSSLNLLVHKNNFKEVENEKFLFFRHRCFVVDKKAREDAE